MRTVLLFGVLFASVLTSTAANATTYYFSGAQCNAQNNNVYLHPYVGAYNDSATTDYNVFCGTGGIEVTTNGIVSASATVYDRHDTYNVSCTLTVTTDTGYLVYQNTQTTSSWSASSMTLNWTVGTTGGNYASINCTIPRKHGTNGASHVATYKVVN